MHMSTLVKDLSWPARLAVFTMSAVAIVLTGRLALFMVDVDRMHLSVVDRPFFRTHSCLSSYTEAARLAATGANIFEIRQYATALGPGEYRPRYIGPLEVDLYQYPPTFLVLPYGPVRSGIDFFTIRTSWFVIQAALLLGAMVLAARWIGGAHGRTMLLLLPLVWIATPTRLGLQIGNFQLTAVPLALLAMIAFDRRRDAAGGLALGFVSASKIFPGILGVILLAQRRWGAVAWTLAAAAGIAALAWLAVGTTPFVDFVRYQVPRIESGEAFFWIEDPQTSAVNQSIYGLVTKLRVLGVPWTTQSAANLASSAYALLLLPVSVIAAMQLARLRRDGRDAATVRLRHAQVWLALVSLASFRSPFVPDAYGMVGTLWLLTMLAAEGARATRWAGLGVLGIMLSLVLDGGAVPTPIPAWVALATLGIQLAALSINLYVVLTPARGSVHEERPRGMHHATV